MRLVYMNGDRKMERSFEMIVIKNGTDIVMGLPTELKSFDLPSAPVCRVSDILYIINEEEEDG